MSSSVLGYMHGTSESEQARLARLNESLNDRCLREIGLADGERVLDFGCGLGQLTRLLSRAVGPSGRVVGFDASPQQLGRAHALAAADSEADLVDFRLGDVTSPPLREGEPGTFDVAHARFVLEHVTDPEAVVREMIRAVRPGGRVVIIDDDHAALRVWPEPAGLVQLWDTYVLLTARNQNDPFVGRRLPSLLHRAGATPVRVGGIFYGGAGRTPALRSVVENVVGLFDGVRHHLVELARIDEAEYEATIASFRDWAERPGAAFWYSFHLAEGVRRADA